MSTFNSFNPNPCLAFLNPLYLIRRRLFLLVREFAPSLTGKILDFGCGSKPYRKFFNVEQYIGIDIAVSGHDHSQSEVDIFYDGQHIPFDDNHFDGVFCSEVFEHVFNLPRIIAELNRVTKLNGKLLITIPFAWPEHEQPHDFARYTSFGITHLLGDHGFKVLHLRKSGHFSEVILQQILLFMLLHCHPANKIARAITRLFLFAPVYLIGNFLITLLPKDDRCYHNILISAEKISAGKTNS